MILADTSVWIDHLRNTSLRLSSLLEGGEILAHPFVIGELACGRLRNRREILELLGALPQAGEADHEEALAFVAAHRLEGRGLGWVDVHLLASARLSGAGLWTLDRPLASAAAALGLDD